MNDKITGLKKETVTSVPGVLKMINIWSEDSSFFVFFMKYDYIVDILISLYSREKINLKVIQILHKIFFNLLNIHENVNLIEDFPEFPCFFEKYYQKILQNIYIYLEFNLAPSNLLKKNKQKKIDSSSLEIVYFISSRVKI